MKEIFKPIVKALNISQEAKDEINAFFEKKTEEIIASVEEMKTLLTPHKEELISLLEIYTPSKMDESSLLLIRNFFENVEDTVKNDNSI